MQDGSVSDASGAVDPKTALKAKRAEIEAKNSGEELVFFEVPGHGLFVVKTPEPDVYSVFQNRVSEDSSDSTMAVREYVLSSTVHPELSAARAILLKKPAFAGVAAKAVSRLGGSEIKELGKD